MCKDTIIQKPDGERKLATAQDFFENIFMTTVDGFIVTDHVGYIIRVNNAIEGMLGLTSQDLAGKHLADIIPEATKDTPYKDMVSRIFLEISEKKFIDRFETTLLNVENKTSRVEFTISLLKDKNSTVTGTVISVRDITERRMLEQELLRAKRLESISALAGGIASDFDSILTTILGNINIVQNFISTDDKNFVYLATAEKEALRAKDLINQLTTFSKNRGLLKKKDSLIEVLTSVAQQSLKGSKVACEFNFAADIWAVEFDREQIIQVLRSLFMNAEHSMPEGGIINIDAENYFIDKHLNIPLKQGRYLKITIKDQGIGILNEYIQDIFDPYFKKGRKRSGLVLASAYSIIKKHNGLISVESEFGAGTTFFIYLPAQEV